MAEAKTEVQAAENLIEAYKALLKMENDVLRRKTLKQWIKHRELEIEQHKRANSKRA